MQQHFDSAVERYCRERRPVLKFNTVPRPPHARVISTEQQAIRELCQTFAIDDRSAGRNIKVYYNGHQYIALFTPVGIPLPATRRPRGYTTLISLGHRMTPLTKADIRKARTLATKLIYQYRMDRWGKKRARGRKGRVVSTIRRSP